MQAQHYNTNTIIIQIQFREKCTTKAKLRTVNELQANRRSTKYIYNAQIKAIHTMSAAKVNFPFLPLNSTIEFPRQQTYLKNSIFAPALN